MGPGFDCAKVTNRIADPCQDSTGFTIFGIPDNEVLKTGVGIGPPVLRYQPRAQRKILDTDRIVAARALETDLAD